MKHPGLCGETRRNLFAISKDVECKVAKESRCLFSRLWNGGSLRHLDLGIKVIAASAEVFPLRFLNVRELRDASCLLFRKNPDSRISISRLKLRSLQLTRSLLDVHDQVTLKHSGKRQMETLNKPRHVSMELLASMQHMHGKGQGKGQEDQGASFWNCKDPWWPCNSCAGKYRRT